MRSSSSPRARAGLTVAVLIAVLSAVLAAATASFPAGAGATTYTPLPAAGAAWAGTGTNFDWSAPSNWSTGSVPTTPTSALDFPNTSAGCANSDCTFSVDDLPGLTIGVLGIDAALGYRIVPLSSSDGITLSGPLEFVPTEATSTGAVTTNLAVPLTLTAGGVWTVAGIPGVDTRLSLSTVTGNPRAPVAINLSNNASLAAASLDTGPLAIKGNGTVVLRQSSIGPLTGSAPATPPNVGPRGVTLEGGANLTVEPAGSVSGPLSVVRGSNTVLQIGRGVAPDGTLSVSGNLTLRQSSTIDFSIDQPASGKKPVAGTDYSQLTATGNVLLKGATLELSRGFAQGACLKLKGGQTYALISTRGKLEGQFAGVSSGQVVALAPCTPTSTGADDAAVVRYNTRTRPRTVTATVIGGAQIRALVEQAVATPTATVARLIGTGSYVTSFDAPALGRLAVTWTATSGGRRVSVAGAALSAGHVGPTRLTIKLSKAGRALLERSSDVAVTASANFTPSSGNQTTVSRRFRIG